VTLEGQLDVAVGGDVVFTFAVSNAGTEPVTLRFTDGLLADVAAYDEDEEVWRWSDDHAFVQALGTETLLPGESFAHDATWTDPVPGEYTGVASLEAENVTLDAREPFEV